MKKFVCAMLALLLCGLAVATVVMDGKLPELPAAEKTAESAAEAGVDYAAIYALHDPDEVVMTVDGQDVTWEEYFYFYHNQAVGLENMFLTYQYYGMAVGWESPADEEGHSYADLLADAAENELRQFYLWEAVERESGAVLTEEEEAQLQAEHEGYIPYFAGEGATEEDMFAVLQSENYMSEAMYWRIMQKLYLQEPTFRAMMGENGEKVSEEEVEAWAEENLPGYSVVSLDRIHISTLDPETNEPMDENAAAQQAALAQELAAQLQAVEDPMERVALFQKLKAQYDPEGISYVAVGSRIEAPIYEATLAMENGQISDPVEVDGDYYIILRRAFRADDVIDTGAGEQPVRELAAEDIFNQLLLDRQENQQLRYAEGFEAPRLLDYYTRPSYAA